MLTVQLSTDGPAVCAARRRAGPRRHSDLELGQDAARAAVSAADTQLVLNEAEYKRYKELRDQGFISGLELERREASLKARRAQAEQARAQASVQRNQAGYAVLVTDVGRGDGC